MQNVSTFHQELIILCHCLLLILHWSDAFWCFSDALFSKKRGGGRGGSAPNTRPGQVLRSWTPLGPGAVPLRPPRRDRPSAWCVSRTLLANDSLHSSAPPLDLPVPPLAIFPTSALAFKVLIDSSCQKYRKRHHTSIVLHACPLKIVCHKNIKFDHNRAFQQCL